MVILFSIGGLILAFVPAFVWLTLFLKEDMHPEPKSLIMKTFGIGALITLLVLVLQALTRLAMEGAYSELALFSIAAFAFIEETMKFFSGYFYIRKKKEFDEPVDAMIYLVALGLGFATIENIFILFPYVISPSATSFFEGGETIAMRFIGATLLHTLTGAIVGYYWAKGILKKSQGVYIAIGIVITTLIHMTFNYLLVVFQSINIIYPTIFLVAVSFFVLRDFEKIKEVQRPI